MSRILLIEPDRQLAAVYARFLGGQGHAVQVAHHAQAAVLNADANSPDVVLLELELAGHNGVEFVYEFRSYPEWQTVPIILLTHVPPHALLITDSQLRQLGIVEVLYKPATKLLTIGRAVSRHSAPVAA